MRGGLHVRSLDEIEQDMLANNVTPETIDTEIKNLEDELISFLGGSLWNSE